MYYISKMPEFKMPKPANRKVLVRGHTTYWRKDEILPWLEKNGYFNIRISGKDPANNSDWYFTDILPLFVDRTLIPVAKNALYWKLNNYSKMVKLKEIDADHKPRFDNNFGRVMK
jgi:hypothetical protein